MKDLKISLIIPAYNEEKYIEECLEHAIKNSMHDSSSSSPASSASHKNARSTAFHEIIVVDNASTDKTRSVVEKIVKKYPAAGIRIVHEPQKGLTKARQRGLSEASKEADILAYIDSDTHMPRHWTKKVLHEFSKNGQLACLSGPYFYYDLPLHNRMWVKLYWWILGIPSYKITGYMITGGNFAIKREVLEKMQGFDTSIAFYGEDTNIARRASKFGKVKFTLNLCMDTSARRLKEQGVWRTAYTYVINYLSEVLAKKPITKEYQDIR